MDAVVMMPDRGCFYRRLVRLYAVDQYSNNVLLLSLRSKFLCMTLVVFLTSDGPPGPSLCRSKLDDVFPFSK
jgi:hypothetical protein